MSIRPIRTDEDHRAALEEIEALWGADDGTPEGDRLDVLVDLVVDYEERRWPNGTGVPYGLLKERNAARRLARMGGSDPTATAGPRRRFW